MHDSHLCAQFLLASDILNQASGRNMKNKIYTFLAIGYLLLVNIGTSQAIPISINYEFRNGSSTLYDSINFTESGVGLAVTLN